MSIRDKQSEIARQRRLDERLRTMADRIAQLERDLACYERIEAEYEGVYEHGVHGKLWLKSWERARADDQEME